MGVRTLKVVAAALLASLAAAPAPGPAAAAQGSERRPTDLAQMVEGAYAGDVVSDARGSSRSGVRIIVTRIGPNRVRVAADYPRLPAFEATLERVMDTVQNADGHAVFLLDLATSPNTLHVTVDDAAWFGTRD